MRKQRRDGTREETDGAVKTRKAKDLTVCMERGRQEDTGMERRGGDKLKERKETEQETTEGEGKKEEEIRGQRRL